MMRKSFTVLLAGSVFLAGCGGWGGSRLNPGNWFGGGRSVATSADAANPLIPQGSSLISRPKAVDRSEKIAVISELAIEREPGGAIIRAKGIGARQGAYAARLAPINADMVSENGTLSFDFLVVYPKAATPVGTELSRSVDVAFTMTNQQLEGVSVIRVNGVQNAQESRRR